MKVAAVIGWPLEHSLSPVFQQAAFDEYGLNIRFEVWKTAPREVGKLRAKLLDGNCLGACVTVPHKETLLKVVDKPDDEVRRIGALNWIAHRDQKLHATNTDGDAFIWALENEFNLSVAGRRFFVFGAGGAAKAVVKKLTANGADEVVLASRTMNNARRLAESCQNTPTRVLTVPKYERRLGDFDVAINASVAGMSGGPAPDYSPLATDEAGGIKFGYDLVYAPTVTPFMTNLRLAGAKVANGISMLVKQGALGFEYLTGREAPIATMFKALDGAVR